MRRRVCTGQWQGQASREPEEGSGNSLAESVKNGGGRGLHDTALSEGGETHQFLRNNVLGHPEN